MAALFFDIDGTLLSEVTGKVPDSALKALRAAKEAGHQVFVNTGRTCCSIPQEILRIPFDGFLCGCGIHLSHHGEVVFETHLSDAEREGIENMAAKCSVECIYEGEKDVFFRDYPSRYERLESTKRYMNKRGLGLECHVGRDACAFDKIFVYVDDRTDTEKFFAYIRSFMDIIDRGNHAYECVMKGYSKATAIDCILERLHMDRSQSYGFGDSSNDLTMLQCVEHAVAMGAHDPVLDPYVELVAERVEDDGIFHAMQQLGLI